MYMFEYLLLPFFLKIADREFDLNGHIKELEIKYPKDVDIPIVAIEQFKNTIRTGNLKLVFDKAHKAFAISPWIGRIFRYNPNTMKEMAP